MSKCSSSEWPLSTQKRGPAGTDAEAASLRSVDQISRFVTLVADYGGNMSNPKPRPIPRYDRRFFLACAIWVVVTSLLAFIPPTITRTLQPDGWPYAHPSIALHAVTFTAWVLLFLVQTVLIRRGNPALHRKLGLVGAILLPLVFYAGTAMIMTKWQVGLASQSQTAFNAMTFVTGFGLGVVGLALHKNAFVHKRLMLGATVLLTTASPARALGLLGLDFGFYGNQVIIAAPLLALLIYDAWFYRRPIVALFPLIAFLLTSTMYIHRPLLVNQTGEALMEAIAPAFMPWDDSL